MSKILIAILLINGFVLLLCSLLSLASRLLRQAGRVNLEVNGQTEQSECGQPLLQALAPRQIFLPAACGGKGTCGRCEVKVLAGGGHHTPLELLQLAPEKIAAQSRLACQVRVREDLRVQVAAALLNARSYTVRLKETRQVAPTIKTLTFALPDDQQIDFLPGQYMQVAFQQPWEKVLRAYSLASPPQKRNSFSFDVQRVDGGLVSNYLHGLVPGDPIEVSGPFGDMTLRSEHLDRPLILVAGGVGLAPMRSMIAHLEHDGFKTPVMLFHGARSREHLYYEEHYRNLARTCARFRYFPALSQPLLEDGWTEARGMVHTLIEQQLAVATPGKNEPVAFICGPAPMMDAVTKVLVAKGLPSDRIFTDPFDF
ncbi:MAG TPA: FAD-binding oxidoreductase [Candidatus Rifleibacterium sp.]|nr:FAD-binding oxidoreductase [Candidatus Rifleibacterium sp.]HPT45725.1 FAD-binding oxidoreductase [Candidatus Rifleibacterium sp.]